MNNEEVAKKLVNHITEVEDYLDNLFYWLQHRTESNSKEYQEGTNKVQQLLEELQLFDPSNNQAKHPMMILSDAEGNVLGTSESTKDTKKDAEYPSITVTLYDAEDNTIGRCDSITGDATSGVYDILYLRGVDFYKNKSIDDLKKVEVTYFGGVLVEYLVLVSTKFPGDNKDTVRCTTLKLTDTEVEDE